MSRVTCKWFGYWRIAGCQSERRPASRRETDAAELQGGTEAASGGEFQVHRGEFGSGCGVRGRCSRGSCGFMRERWRSGSRGGPSRIRRRRRWCCWCVSIPIRWSGWRRWQRGEAVPMKPRNQTPRPGQGKRHRRLGHSPCISSMIYMD